MPNGQLKLKKSSPERLRAMGLDEAWLQNQISLDTSLLGFGDLHLIQRERSQPTGGRIDFLMYDPGSETRYEVEVMLGPTDESHIIRAIEYWDMERQRYPTLDHRAVIVAEEITARFFNVIRLLNRSVPIIAIQLSAFRIGDEVVLHFTRVLDTYEFGEDAEDESAELVDPGYWQKKSKPESLAVIEAIKAITPNAKGQPRITYNKYHVALGTSGYNFCWFHPRKVASHCHIELKVMPENRQEIIDHLEKDGIEAESRGRSLISVNLTVEEIEKHNDLIQALIEMAEEWSHR